VVLVSVLVGQSEWQEWQEWQGSTVRVHRRRRRCRRLLRGCAAARTSTAVGTADLIVVARVLNHRVGIRAPPTAAV